MEYTYSWDENCLLKSHCYLANTERCNENCIIQPEFQYLLKTSNIPVKLQKPTTLYPEDCDYETFKILAEIKNDVLTFVKEGRWLYLWGSSPGSSKSSWAAKIINTYIVLICIGNEFKDRVWFEYIPSFLLMAKEFESEERIEHIHNLLTRDLVVLDDIGAVKNSNYDMTVLSNVINTRYSNNLATIFTSNLSPDNLQTAIDIRLADRVLSDIVLELKGGSRRNFVSNYKRKSDDISECS